MADSATIIGNTILVSGHLDGDEDLTVQGRVHGTVNLTKTLVVEESGIVKADVSVRNAVVSGVIVGNITASDSVEITEVGRMMGDISAPRVIIVDGARFRGNVDMGNLDAPRASQPLPSRTVERSSLTKRTSPAATGAGATSMSAAAARPAPPPRAAPAPAPAPTPAPARADDATKVTKPKAPMAAKKKIKKKVVVKKKKG